MQLATTGISHSRPTIGPWDRLPPPLHTTPLSIGKTGVYADWEDGHTMMSPHCSFFRSADVMTTQARPSATPGEPGLPKQSAPVDGSGVTNSPIVILAMIGSLAATMNPPASGGVIFGSLG